MRTEELHYDLPQELIAQVPCDKRDMSRMLVLDRSDGSTQHRQFCDILEYLTPGDVLVVNNTRVLPCKLIGRRRTGGKVDAVLVREVAPKRWSALMRSTRHLHNGEPVSFEDGEIPTVYVGKGEDGLAIFEFETDEVVALLKKAARAPLPPYIKRDVWHDSLRGDDLDRYQTVYAEKNGAIAAPTAGLHFTPELLSRIRDMSVDTVSVTLHVGPGTFRPIKTEMVEDHTVDAEYYEVTPEALERLDRARSEGHRVIAVGTTSTRVLEALARMDKPELCGWTDLVIFPPFDFRCVDALITNFHLPDSSLLALVCAFAGKEPTLAAYEEAMQREYRFYSYGDAMFIHGKCERTT